MERNQEEDKNMLDDGDQENQANDFEEKKDVPQPNQMLLENEPEHDVE